MTKTEFLDALQRALASGLSSSNVAENMRYYQDYIDSEIRKGNSEESVLESLGNPRLLAKSIIEANKRAGTNEGSNQTFDEESSSYGERENRKVFTLPGWLIMLIATVVVILVIGAVLSILTTLLPILIPVLIVILIINIFKNNQ